jgi:hypothetical protein
MSAVSSPGRPRVRHTGLATGALLAVLAPWLLDACVYRSETIECENGVRCPPGLVCVESHRVCGPADKVAACSGFVDGASCEIAELRGVCRQGMCERTPCQRSSDCNGDDDLNPCTNLVCNQGYCEYEANTASCDDGQFCNGPDRCQDTQCVPTGVSPCSENTVCDEDLRSCVGCELDTDCEDTSFTDWSDCQKGTDVCAISGLRSRLEVSWTCVNNRCEPFGASESETCALPEPTSITCDDKDKCTVTDQCTATGQCTGQPTNCDDDNACTADTCPPDTGCTHVNEPFGTLCPGGNCDGAGECLACPNAGQPCSDLGFGDCEAGILLCDESGNQQCVSLGAKLAGTPCRDPQGVCDAQEFCDGTSLACPADTPVQNGTPCGSGLQCVAGVCL